MTMRDLIIIGAGPAGATAAWQAARLGLAPLLIDKDRFPRFKPCGGGVTMRAVKALGFPLPGDLVENRLMGARIRVEDRQVEVRRPSPVTLCVQRAAFDHLLARQAEQAGAELLFGIRVCGLEPHGDGVDVHLADGRTLGARYVIVAEGSSGRLKRSVRRPDTREHNWLCLCADAPSPARYAHDDLMDIRCGLTPTGYAWVFPRNGQANVGLGALAHEFDDPKGKLLDHLRRNGFAQDRPVLAHTIPLGGVRRKLANGRILLAGDAGGFADAFSCEGIAYAILSGRAAARAVADALRGQPLPRAYARHCTPLLRELRGSYLCFRFANALPRAVYNALITDRSCLEHYLDVTAGERSYHWFLAKLVASTPRLAAKALGNRT